MNTQEPTSYTDSQLSCLSFPPIIYLLQPIVLIGLYIQSQPLVTDISLQGASQHWPGPWMDAIIQGEPLFRLRSEHSTFTSACPAVTVTVGPQQFEIPVLLNLPLSLFISLPTLSSSLIICGKTLVIPIFVTLDLCKLLLTCWVGSLVCVWLIASLSSIANASRLSSAVSVP